MFMSKCETCFSEIGTKYTNNVTLQVFSMNLSHVYKKTRSISIKRQSKLLFSVVIHITHSIWLCALFVNPLPMIKPGWTSFKVSPDIFQ